jgi:hypothetical protein
VAGKLLLFDIKTKRLEVSFCCMQQCASLGDTVLVHEMHKRRNESRGKHVLCLHSYGRTIFGH